MSANFRLLFELELRRESGFVFKLLGLSAWYGMGLMLRRVTNSFRVGLGLFEK